MTSTQGALSFVTLDCKQASTLPRPGSTPPHNELTSPRHAFATAATATNTAWHGRERSARCELRQDLIPPGATSPQAALISAAHSSPDLSLLRHRVCCREHHARTDCKNY